MKKILLPLTLLLLPCVLLGQSNVDRLVSALDSLRTVKYDNWRVSPDLKRFPREAGDPSQPGFNDAGWDILRLNQWIYPDSCWLRKEIVLPEAILGRPVKGSVRFLVSVDDYGYLWVNGESRGYFPWDGEFELTKDAHPGQKFLLAIKAINTGGPLRLLRAEIETDATKPMRTLIGDFSLSLRVGQKLLSFDTYQTSSNNKVDPGIDKSRADRSEKTRLNGLLQSLAVQVDVQSLEEGSLDRFQASVDKVRAALKPIGEFAKRYILYFDANAHIDAAWLWRDKETIEVCKNTFTSVLNMMDARPDFTYTQSAAAYYDWMERLYPDVFRRIQDRVKDKRWEVVGGMWVEPDCNLPSGESWMRHLLYAKKYFERKLGDTVSIGWNPDSFGYNWNMPEFYEDAGIDAFITQKIGWNERNVFPYRVFWWKSADGSKVLSYFPFDYVNTIEDPYRLVDWLRQFEANSGFTKMMMLFGVGDHGGGPSPEMLDRIEHLKTLDVYPTIEYGTAHAYLDWLAKNDLSGIPVWNDELYLEYHQGTYTTHAKTKEWNRRSEVLLTNAEKFSTLATRLGGPYHGGDLEEAWRNVLFNQFHDILPGSGIRENYIDATEKYKASEEIGTVELDGALDRIAGQINTSTVARATPVAVFNPLAWERGGIVTLQLPKGDASPYAIVGADGKEIPSQMVETGKYTRSMLFTASGVPSLGYRLYGLKKGSSAAGAGKLSITRDAIKNEYLRVTVDTSTGWLKSIIDKRNGKELLTGAGNELQMLEDLPKEYDAWNIGLTGVLYPTRLRTIEIAEQGPVRATLRIVRDYLKPGVKKDLPTPDYPSTFFTQDISLYDGIDQVFFTTDVDWWEDHTMLKVAFPVSVKDTAATYEIPYGTIERSTLYRNSWDSAKVEVPAIRWGDLSERDYGISLINNSKYGYDIKGNIIRLSLLRSPKWPDPTADRGKHSIEYSLYPHSGTWRQAQTVRRGYEFNNPLIARLEGTHKGKLPAAQSFVRLEPSSLVLTTMKKAEDSDAWIIQWYDAAGGAADAALTLPAVPKKVVATNAMEEDGRPVPFEKNVVKSPTKKNGLMTVKIWF